ncbi:hypothetical protein DOTSEDRAFT_35048 [Dothistroma septosporum NZE10]|uniref:Uncharacterized protein n=1 Tax=Dothistroma septosporum (strain NZE10 / CBS 128990) TaxID=675120 RepID=N1PQN7_DOTSN|nr:hypothetical protein DOTSEDRAFT_35048 [Dothistroma septosporum NZE10]
MDEPTPIFEALSWTWGKSDLEERGQQVSVMDDICSKTACVLVGLGLADATSETAVQDIDQILAQCSRDGQWLPGSRRTILTRKSDLAPTSPCQPATDRPCYISTPYPGSCAPGFIKKLCCAEKHWSFETATLPPGATSPSQHNSSHIILISANTVDM